MKKIITTISILAGTYGVTFAQIPTPVVTTNTGQIGQSVFSLLNLAQQTINALVPLLIGLAVVFLFIGVIGFMTQKGSDDHAKWGKFLGYGILGLFVMVSIWGIVNFLGSVVGVGQGGGVPVPQVPGGPRP
jgi:hypothetical protein